MVCVRPDGRTQTNGKEAPIPPPRFPHRRKGICGCETRERHVSERMRKVLNIGMMICIALLSGACSLIDDDLSNCGQNYTLEYQMQLITNMEVEIEQVLSAEADEPLARALRRELGTVFSDHAHDVDLSFFSTGEVEELQHHLQQIVDSNRTSFTFYLPKENYMHLAAANLTENKQVVLTDATGSHTMCLRQVEGDTVGGHETGLFTARLPMQVVDTADQTFEVNLYMANCASALIIDTTGYSGRFITAYAEGLADAFYVRDSVYGFERKQYVRAKQVKLENSAAGPARMAAETPAGHAVCYTAVSFPSADAADSEGNYWKMRVYVKLPDGKITENILSVNTPLRAGALKIIRTKMQADGGLVPVANTDVGAVVKLNWGEGSTYNPNF